MPAAPPTDPSRPLAGVGVLVTRPAHQAEGLVRLIAEAGGRAVRFPTIAIAPPADPETLAPILERLSEFDLAVFVSPNAVEQACAQLAARGIAWPAHLAAFGVGRATLAALARAGIEARAPAQRFDSEALLALPDLRDVRGRNAVIFRGDGGRELLAETLAARGARVTFAECYRRVRPAVDPAPVLAGLARGEIQVVVVTSSDGLRNLLALLGPPAREHLKRASIVVLSETQAQLCRRADIGAEVCVAPEASDEAILETVKACRGSRFSL